MRVLIADCDREFLDIAKRFMTQCGHEAMIASNGLECIACLRDLAPDIVVLDSELQWGGSDGVCEFMKEEPTLEAIPIILITDEELECKTDYKADFRIFDRMKKPYSLTQLVGRLQRSNGMSLAEMADSDEADRELLQQVKSSLHQLGYRAIGTLEIQIERGTAVLQGRVPTFYLRQIAVECVKRLTGVTQIIDRIDVVNLPDDCGVKESSEVASVTTVVSTEHRMGAPNAVRAMQDKRRVRVNRRQLISTAKG
jgi:DNA-binding response OmpR family regulator